MDTIEGVIYLARCAVKEEKADKSVVDGLDLDAVYREASRHMIAAMCGMALKDAGISTPAFKTAIASAQRKTVTLNYEMAAVCRELETAGIWHMPLKGSIIKDWYPKFGMREMVDCDILYDKSRIGDMRRIMSSLGFSTVIVDEMHHDIFQKKPISTFEMHTELFGPGHKKQVNTYYSNIEKKLLKKANYENEFSPDDLYLYLMTHEYEHYSTSGTGIRSVVDTYVALKTIADKLNWNYIAQETEKIGISEFEEKNRNLALHLFDGQISDQEKAMLSYMADSGSHGTMENNIMNAVESRGGGILGKVKYIWHRVVLPMDVVQRFYPIFYKHKILLPFLPIYRLYRGCRRGMAVVEVKLLTKV